MIRETNCEWARVASSLRLDRDLDPDARRRLEAHVATCPDCDAFASDLLELRERITGWPRESAPVDLAARVRARAFGGAIAPRGLPWLQRAAAIVIAGFSLFVAFSIGRIAADREPRTYVFQVPDHALLAGGPPVESPASEPSGAAPAQDAPRVAESRQPELVGLDQPGADERPAPPESPLGENDEARRVARAARAVLADLAVLDEIPEERRKPLLESQVRHFGLEEWAQRVDREGIEASALDLPEIVRFVRELESALRSDPTALLALGRDARATELYRTLEDVSPPREPPLAQRRDRRRVVADVASALSAEERADLESLLDVKESWIEGEYGPALGAVTSNPKANSGVETTAFGPALRSNLISVLAEVESSPHFSEGFVGPENDPAPLSTLGFDALKAGQVQIGPGTKGFFFKVEVRGAKQKRK